MMRSISSSTSLHRQTWLKLSETPETDDHATEVGTTAEITSSSVDGASEAVASSGSADFDAFAVGQQFDGNIVSAKKFGVFVDISKGHNALIPRSQLSRGAFEKLKTMAADKSQEKVKIELTNVNAENQTLSANYIIPGRSDISSLNGKDLSALSHEATIVSTHDFGVFAELNEFGVEGLIPASKLPTPLPKGSIQESYKAGEAVSVKIEQLAIDDKKLVLSMHSDSSEQNPLAHVPHTKWFQGIVQSTTSFGLFVRPAGFDAVGLVHQSRIPRGLLAALKRTAPVDPAQNTSDIEQLFSAGDVVKCRVHAAKADSRKIELSMLPFVDTDDEEDGYRVEGRDEGVEEGKSGYNNNGRGGARRGANTASRARADAFANFDPEDTLLWWRGEPYEKVGRLTAPRDEEMEVVMESSQIVEGVWRRMFEVDMREDAADFSSKIFERELKELADEIGELSGLDEEFNELIAGGNSDFNTRQLGTFVSASTLPDDWKTELDFFRELEDAEGSRFSILRGGKASEQEEFERLLKQVESEIANSSSKGRKDPDEKRLVVAGDEPADGVAVGAAAAPPSNSTADAPAASV